MAARKARMEWCCQFYFQARLIDNDNVNDGQVQLLFNEISYPWATEKNWSMVMMYMASIAKMIPLAAMWITMTIDGNL